MDIKNEVLVRAYIVLAVMVLAAVVIFTKAVRIGVIEGEKWRAMGDSLYVDYRPVDAQRGNILAIDGSLLATSLPFFEIRMDLRSSGMTDDDFNKNIDSLAWCLSTYVDQTYTPGGMKFYLQQQREIGNRYLLIKSRANYAEVEKIKSFPLFNLGRFRGGLIVQQKSERRKPFGVLAHRTIGYVREGASPVGLEGKFDKILSGEQGKQMMLRVGSETWLPLNDLTEIEPKDGKDVKTTIDINIQDITESALMRAMQYHNADKGTAIVMEVKTGAIKSIANLGRSSEGYWETFNYAIGAATEPGSTMKIASMMAMLEDGAIKLTDTIDLEQGKTVFYEEEMRDAHPHQIEKTTVKHAFEISSNVGIAKLVWKTYGEKNRAGRFVKRLRDFNLDLPTGIEIDGEATPYIKEAYNKDDHWSGTTLPWMSTGYELMLTPLQVLNFYNAIANNGVMMKPYVVSEIQQYGETIETFKPTIIKRRLASKRTIEKAKELLEAVVDSGTARLLQTHQFRFAGKTGTAQINYQKLKARTNVGGYQASFAGYFPAENPVYSCIVVITNPRDFGIYGSEVAGPVFREIADKLFNSRPELQNAVTELPQPVLASNQKPDMVSGKSDEVIQLLKYFELPFFKTTKEPWTVLKMENDSLKMKPRIIKEKTIPAVTGMGLRDAVYLLENLGLNVEISGVGRVVRQSILAGTPARGQSIRLFLD